VYLADTIRHTLPPATGATRPHIKSNGDTGIMEAFISQMEGPVPCIEEEQAYWTTYKPHLLSAADDFSDEAGLQLYFNNYFTVWHPLFPFLDGLSLRDAFSRCCANARHGNEVFEGMRAEEALVLSVTLQAVFEIGGRRSKLGGTVPTRIDPTLIAHLILSACETSRLDHVVAIRALCAITLSLWNSRRFRSASHLSGTNISEYKLHWSRTDIDIRLELVYEAGLHRCPCRYPTTFVDDAERDLRKRLFYSIYVLDRFLCRHLGLPISLRDIDIDVCLPGAPEIHGSGAPASSPASSRAANRPSTKRKRTEQEDKSPSPVPVHPSNPSEPDILEKSGRTPKTPYTDGQSRQNTPNKLLPAFSLAQLAGIMGRAMETFNGSRRWRVANGKLYRSDNAQS
jgi:hypothetical protein